MTSNFFLIYPIRWTKMTSNIKQGNRGAFKLGQSSCAVSFGIDDRWEFQQESIAHGFNNATTVLGNLAVDQFRPMILQCRKRASLVRAHEARITDHVSQYDSRQSASGSFGHGAILTVGVRASYR